MDYNNFVKKYNSDTFDNYIIEANKIGDLHKRIKHWKTLYLLFEKEKSNISRQNLVMGLRITLDPELRPGNPIMSINFGGLCEEEIKLIEFELKTFIPSKKTLNKITYQWQNNPKIELPELYSLMHDEYKLIASETSLESFTAIFTGQPIDSSIIPIRWHQDNATELIYFIDKLEQSGQVKHTKKADYQKMIACFVKPNGTKFQAAFKNIKTNISINLSLGKQKAIDELVNNF